TGPDVLLEERWIDFANCPSKRYDYAGRQVFNQEGSRWTEYVFVAGDTITLRLAHPVEAIGEELLKTLKTRNFDVDAKNLPFALLFAKIGKNEVIFPLRDLSGLPDPRRVLMHDLMPIERGAQRQLVVEYLTRKLSSGSPAQILVAFDQMAAFSREESAVAQPVALRLRQHVEPDVAERAREFCRNRKWFSDADVRAACQALNGTAIEQKQALILLRTVGSAARVHGQAAVEAYLARHDLPEDLRQLAQAALRRFMGSKKPE
ncbi:MAG: hypothetical protein KDB53_03640, partial [Planctomycetes bacterium]|nr:hypothetical protein [Planctomycetota bacterium]